MTGVRDRGAEDVAVRRSDGGHDIGGRREVVTGEQFCDPGDGEFTRDLARLVSAHSVGDDEDGRGDEETVLVGRAELAGVGGCADAEVGHHCASITVVPTWMRSPGWSSLGLVILDPLWNVPLVEPRSSTIGWPSCS